MHLRLSRITAVLAVFVLFVAVVLMSASPSWAADDTGGSGTGGSVTWMVRPSDGVGEDGRSWIELDLDPGESVQEHLLVRNLSREAQTFRLTAADGYFTDNGRFNMLTSDRESADAGMWITIPDQVMVASGADVVVPFTVTVPENATPGDHAAGVAAAIRSGSSDQVGVESRVGFRVMTRVTGDLAPAAAATVDGSYEGTWNPFETGRLSIGYTVSNTGNTRLSIAPRLTATTLFGLVSFEVSGDDVAEIAPGESRTSTIAIPSVWPLFAYTAMVTATPTMIGADAQPVPVAAATATTTIGAIPWPQLVVIALAALIVWWLWRDRRHRDAKIAALVEQARQKIREESADRQHAEVPARRFEVGGAAVAFLLAAMLAFGSVAQPAQAVASAEPPTESGTVVIHVEITGRSPVPDGLPGTGALPATGGMDPAPLAWGGSVALALGAVLLVGARRIRNARAH